MSNVTVSIINNAGASSPFVDPFISIVGTADGQAQNFNIAINGQCTPVSQNGSGNTIIQLSALNGQPLLFDASMQIDSGRIYFSTNNQAVTTSGIDPVSAAFYYDWVEFALNIGQQSQLVVNTTQVDQFGIPIELTVNPADPNFGSNAGIKLDRTTVLSDFSSQAPSAYQDCLFPVTPPTKLASYWRILSPNQAMVKNTSSALQATFIQAIDDFFTFYSSNKLYLNSDSAYPYVAQVTTSSEKGIDGKAYDYPVLQFSFAANAPINPGITVPPPSGSGPYNIYYPFFTTNNPSGHKSFDNKAILPPPQWWAETLPAGCLTDTESPSQMVFAGNGIFADTFWQLGINSKTPTAQANVLGNLENQINVAFNRGHAQSWITLTGNLSASTETQPPYTSTITLSGSFTQQNIPNTTANLSTGMNVISFGAGIPLTITKINSSTELTVSSPQPILAQNPQYLTFANFYAPGAIWNAYGQFFHQESISIGGRAYALSFDDQGGFSSTLTSEWSNTPSQLTITIGAW